MSQPSHSLVARLIVTSFAVAYSLSATPSFALINDDRTLIEGAKLCTSYLPRHEREYGIPIHLLAAIASTESGRYNKEIGLSLPWPWTINVEGKGYFYDSKEEAIAAVRNLQRRGFQSIDVGCMQVNLHHHPNAFASLEQAFDPAYNVAYAASFLKHNYEDEGSWRKATADYHSRTPIFGEQYARLVYNSWSRIINKIADARAGKSLKAEVAAADSLKTPITLINEKTKQPYRHSYHALHMHSISVSRDPDVSKEKGILVIRPGRDNISLLDKHEDTDDKFVTHNVKSPDAEPPVIVQKAEIIKASDTKQVSVKGQFSPSAHVVRVNDNPSAEKTIKPNSVFVFDN